MANKCAICGCDVNLITGQKLIDGNYICRKNCRSKGMKEFDFMHATIGDVNQHLEQVEKGTKLWNHYFEPRKKTKVKEEKLKDFYPMYVAEDIGLLALIEDRYKALMFGKSTIACVYRIADLVMYELESEEKTVNDKTETKYYLCCSFRNTSGLYDFKMETSYSTCVDAIRYFDKLFGLTDSLKDKVSQFKNQTKAIKDIGSALSSALKKEDDLAERAMKAVDSVGNIVEGDRSKLIERADKALSEFQG